VEVLRMLDSRIKMIKMRLLRELLRKQYGSSKYVDVTVRYKTLDPASGDIVEDMVRFVVPDDTYVEETTNRFLAEVNIVGDEELTEEDRKNIAKVVKRVVWDQSWFEITPVGKPLETTEESNWGTMEEEPSSEEGIEWEFTEIKRDGRSYEAAVGTVGVGAQLYSVAKAPDLSLSQNEIASLVRANLLGMEVTAVETIE
jgi:hypothetical protein